MLKDEFWHSSILFDPYAELPRCLDDEGNTDFDSIYWNKFPFQWFLIRPMQLIIEVKVYNFETICGLLKHRNFHVELHNKW